MRNNPCFLSFKTGMQQSLHHRPPPMPQRSATRYLQGWREEVFCGPYMEEGGVFPRHWIRGRVFSGPWNRRRGIPWDPGWREGVLPGPWMEGGVIPWAPNGGRRHSPHPGGYHCVHVRTEGLFPGPWIEGGGIPWTLQGRGIPGTLERMGVFPGL